MKIIYIVNARIPTEKAHGLQIMKSCEAFSKVGIKTMLLVPTRINTLKDDPFRYYGVAKTFDIKKVFSIDLFHILPVTIAFYVHAIIFAFLASIFALRHKNSNTVLYSRDYVSLFFLSLFGLNPIAEIHDYRAVRPRWGFRFIVRRARKIVVNSEGTRALLGEHYKIGSEKIIVIPNGVDCGFFAIPMTKDSARIQCGMPLNRPIIAYVGSLETVGKEKGVAFLLGAFATLNKTEKQSILYIVGGPDARVAQYKDHARALEIPSENIVFTGHVTYKDIPVYLRAVDAVVIPLPRNQHAETTSPMKLFEFLAAGKVIISADLPGLRAHLNKQNAFLFAPEDKEALAEQIRRAINDVDGAARRAAQAIADARNYGWEARAEKIIAFIKK